MIDKLLFFKASFVLIFYAFVVGVKMCCVGIGCVDLTSLFIHVSRGKVNIYVGVACRSCISEVSHKSYPNFMCSHSCILVSFMK